jgi:hypothetical protein
MNFDEKIREQLEGMDIQQQCHFAWQCGQRALPFLSTKRSFAYWPEEKKLNYLYSIFYALDICAQAAFLDEYTTMQYASAYANAAYEAAEAALTYAKRIADNTNDYTSAHIVAEVAKAAGPAAFAACGQHVTTFTVEAATASYDAAFDVLYYYKPILFEDVKAIREHNLSMFNNDKRIYGKLWQYFQEDLNAIGCNYWAQLYDDLFDNGLSIDTAELKRRLSIPDRSRKNALYCKYIENA